MNRIILTKCEGYCRKLPADRTHSKLERREYEQSEHRHFADGEARQLLASPSAISDD